MNPVAVTAYGTVPFTAKSRPVEDVIFDAASSLLADNPGVLREDIDTVLVSTNDDAKYLGAITAEMLGVRPRFSHSVENMCGSGTGAIVSAFSYVAAGLSRAALVVGADASDGPGQLLKWDLARGEFMHPVFWASIFARSYKDRYGVSSEDLASVAAKNHRNAQDNPNAISDREYSVREVLDSRKITEDLRLLECSRPSTGGSAVLVSSEHHARQVTDSPVWIRGVGQKTVSARFVGIGDFAAMQSAAEAARQAFAMSGTEPGNVDVAEVHDAFTVCEALAAEEIGLAGKGMGAAFCRNLYDTDDRRLNPRGGLIGAGHPLGATGVAQAAEVAAQLQGRADGRQVDSAETGLVHNMSAAATSSTILVMSR